MPTYDIFAKRDEQQPVAFQSDSLPEKLRNQILHIWRDTLSKLDKIDDYFTQSTSNPYFSAIRGILLRECGKLFLYGERLGPIADCTQCLLKSDDVPLVLSLIEMTFSGIVGAPDEFAEDFSQTPDDAVSELNRRFRENGVGFEFDSRSRKLIPFSNLALHQNVVEPALTLLADPKFKAANDEYRSALEHFKKAEWGDCLSEACKAYESTLKIVNGQHSQPTDTAKPLLDAYRQHAAPGKLLPCFTTLLAIIPTLRNKLDAHGGGAAPNNPPEYLAKYALHATAAAIVLLVDAAK